MWTLLLRLQCGSEKRLKYVETFCTALLTWTSWSVVPPGTIHVEESCEAKLSKVTVQKHPSKTTQTLYAEILHCIPVSRTHDQHNTNVPTFVLDKVRERLDILCNTQCISVQGSVEWE